MLAFMGGVLVGLTIGLGAWLWWAVLWARDDGPNSAAKPPGADATTRQAGGTSQSRD